MCGTCVFCLLYTYIVVLFTVVLIVVVVSNNNIIYNMNKRYTRDIYSDNLSGVKYIRQKQNIIKLRMRTTIELSPRAAELNCAKYASGSKGGW